MKTQVVIMVLLLAGYCALHELAHSAVNRSYGFDSSFGLDDKGFYALRSQDSSITLTDADWRAYQAVQASAEVTNVQLVVIAGVVLLGFWTIRPRGVGS
jgi:hypothetical protein